MCNLHRMTDHLDPLLAAMSDLMVARGIPFPELSERLKAHMVVAALSRAGGKTTDSRLSVMTGLQRRDIARLRAFEAKAPRPTPMTRLISLWCTDPHYAPGGAPRPIPRTGDSPSFDHLARRVRQDIHPRTLLDTLSDEGIVSIRDDQVHLLKDAYIPRGGSDDQLAYLAANAGDHLRAATANVEGADPPFLDRALHYSGLTQTQARQLQAVYAKGVMALLEDLRRSAESMKDENAGPQNDAAFRVRLGAYGYHHSEDAT